MSRTSDIDFQFEQSQTARDISFALARAGIVMFEGDSIHYHIDDSFDWQQSAKSDLDSVLNLMDEHINERDAVGFTAIWPDSGAGGIFLIQPGAQEISFTPSINRRHLRGHIRFTDIAWYLKELIPAFADNSLMGYIARDVYP